MDLGNEYWPVLKPLLLFLCIEGFNLCFFPLPKNRQIIGFLGSLFSNSGEQGFHFGL